MRKFLLFFIPMFICVVAVHAQKLQSPAKKSVSLQPQQVATTASSQSKIDPQLKSGVNGDNRTTLNSNIKMLAPSKAAAAAKPASARVAQTTAVAPATPRVSVDIKCMVTPELVQVITNAGGKVFASSPADNIITANVPVAALDKIAASADVKFISKAVNLATIKSGTFSTQQVVAKPVTTGPSIRLAKEAAATSQAKQ